MSGELKAAVEWTPADPVAAKPRRRRRRKRRQAPTTRVGVLLFGLRRLAFLLVGLGGAVALVAAIVIWLGGGSANRIFPLAYYIAGGVLGAAALLGGTGTTYPIYWQERPDREHALNMSVVYGCLAALLVAFGFLLDYLLS
jgi:hypothetical protein